MTKVKVSKKLKTLQEAKKGSESTAETSNYQPIRRILKILGVAFIIASIFHGAILKRVGALPVQAASIINTNIYNVQQGDSLWTIVRKKYPKANPAAKIKEIKDLNHLRGNDLHTGQALRLP